MLRPKGRRTVNRLAQHFSNCIRRFSAAQSGVAAIEFAMLLPLMLTLFLGSVELSTGVAINRKAAIAAHTVADLASQYTNVTNADMTNILNAATDIIYPYSSTNLQTDVSELAIDGQGNATVVWSDTLNGTARTVGSSVTIPSNLATPNTYLLLGETTYNYNPSYSSAVTGTMPLNDQIFMRPRQSNAVTRSAS
jgi:Flp pilus assembly protein TadG